MAARHTRRPGAGGGVRGERSAVARTRAGAREVPGARAVEWRVCGVQPRTTVKRSTFGFERLPAASRAATVTR